MPQSEIQPRTIVLWIVAALAAWGIILALGAYFAPGGVDEGRDFRKLWVVAAMVALFLSLWGSVLWIRARKVRLRQQLEESAANDVSDQPGINP